MKESQGNNKNVAKKHQKPEQNDALLINKGMQNRNAQVDR